jgi:hypothetical protein
MFKINVGGLDRILRIAVGLALSSGSSSIRARASGTGPS